MIYHNNNNNEQIKCVRFFIYFKLIYNYLILLLVS